MILAVVIWMRMTIVMTSEHENLVGCRRAQENFGETFGGSAQETILGMNEPNFLTYSRIGS